MQQGKRRRALAEAFPHTVPILAGFLFLGMAYGIYMNVSCLLYTSDAADEL